MKAQINFEFLASAAFYLIAVGAVILNVSSFIPDYRSNLASASKHTEARAVTSSMLTEPGTHSYGTGGQEWEKNSSTRSSVTGFGVASGFHELDINKIQNLTTAGDSGFNYTQFRSVTAAANQYRFRFIFAPVIETPHEFQRGNPPSSDPVITTPDSTSFNTAGNSVHYGNETVGKEHLRFLVTSHKGVYDTVHLSGDADWDFSDTQSEVRKVGEKVTGTLNVSAIQNRRRDRGSAVFLSGNIKTFGANPDSASSVVNIDRYAELNGEPLRLEVLVW